MEFLKNDFFSPFSEKEKRELTPDEKMAEHFESSRRIESGNFEKINFEKNNSKTPLNQKQKRDDDLVFAKEKLCRMVKSFIDENCDFTDEQKEQQLEKFTKALELAMEIHCDQKPRPDGPYVNHILRVSTRIIEEYGIKDLELLIAALLHDSVEDQSEKLANLSNNDNNISKREKAFLFINDNFGKRVKNTVFKLTNIEHEDKNISQDQKNKIYLEHVKEAIKDSDVFPIKLADFSDNALNLESVKDIEKRLKLSHKYLPVIDIFINQIEKAQDVFSSEKITEIKNNLLFAIKNINDFINNQEKKIKANETPKKIGSDKPFFNKDNSDERQKEGKRMRFYNWVWLFVSMTKMFSSNPELINSIKEGKYNLLIADDVSARIPSLIFYKVMKEIYSKNGFANPKLVFIPGQRTSTCSYVDLLISEHINEYLKNVDLLNTETNALFITESIDRGKTIEILSDALKRSRINFDAVAFSIFGISGDHIRDEVKQKLEQSNVKIYKADKVYTDTYSVPYSHGVQKVIKKYGDYNVSQKISGVQNYINEARQMVDKISEKIIEQISSENTTIIKDEEIFKYSEKFIEQYWESKY